MKSNSIERIVFITTVMSEALIWESFEEISLKIHITTIVWIAAMKTIKASRLALSNGFPDL